MPIVDRVLQPGRYWVADDLAAAYNVNAMFFRQESPRRLYVRKTNEKPEEGVFAVVDVVAPIRIEEMPFESFGELPAPDPNWTTAQKMAALRAIDPTKIGVWEGATSEAFVNEMEKLGEKIKETAERAAGTAKEVIGEVAETAGETVGKVVRPASGLIWGLALGLTATAVIGGLYVYNTKGKKNG